MSDCLTAPLHQKLKKEREEKMALRAQHHAMEETLVARIDAIAEQVREKDEQVNELNKRMEELVKQEREKEKREGERDKREGERDKRKGERDKRERERDEKLNELFEQGREKDEKLNELFEQGREKDEKLNELFEQGREQDEQISTLTQILYETRQSLSGADAESEWIVVMDTPRLDEIKLRNILDVAMARLAIAARLTDKLPNASIVWRDSLGTSADTVTRRAIAEGLLSREGLQLPESIQNLRKSRQGMDLVVEKYSKIRSRGDRVAYQARPIRALNDTAVQRSQIEGMGVVAEVAYDH
ncbi:hypothetical protein HETIRDRAFT_107156 [Heterobasidion irregulare TC 32-1]|uniref:Uncharacterized protein n=1 Tax=Heterobasidion irregulare (strain TC 32-1) TaxID=747525 RepID=W4KB40_HETIT|nr:uncharacterized protein HETIRDRAFT_107156 [Heterobasidion irregulare TC 32-1]ETW83013.1 hypothetical protein HETIRDRAFT_107156 [Heterobasidion irregulare TC 32-1]